MTTAATIPFHSTFGQQLWSTTGATQRREELVNSFEPNTSSYLSGPASLVIFINAFNMAYQVQFGKYKPGTPEYYDLLTKLYAGKPLSSTVQDIVSVSSLTGEPTMKDLKKMAADTKLFDSVIWYAFDRQGMSLTAGKKAALDALLASRQQNFKLLENEDKFKTVIATNLKSPWRTTALIANFDSCLLYGLQNGCGSHHSVLAGYNGSSQHVLVLDVKYGPAWVKVEALVRAMRTVSTESGLPRGMVEVDMVPGV